jgi:hypothetical protein
MWADGSLGRPGFGSPVYLQKRYTWEGNVIEPRIEFDWDEAEHWPRGSPPRPAGRGGTSSSVIRWTWEWKLSKERNVISTSA